jgi:nonribosomal peptide synthetase DhbF
VAGIARLVAGSNSVVVSRVTSTRALRSALDRWDENVVQFPTFVCVVDGPRRVTYAELDALAETLAAELAAVGIARGGRVAIVAERSLEQLAAVLAVWKLGAIQVPIDPAHPRARVALMLEDADVQAVLAPAAHIDWLSALASCPCLVLAERRAHVARRHASRHIAALGDPAALLYTSGSTGLPRGVISTHANIASYIEASRHHEMLVEGDRLAQLSSPSFDAANELAAMFIPRVTLHVVPQAVKTDVGALIEMFATERISVAHLLPGLIDLIVRHPRRALIRGMRQLCSEGDVLTPAVSRAVSELGVALVNCYGPTETTVYACLHRVAPGDQDVVPIGAPFGGARTFVVDASARLVPTGEVGELVIGGPGVTAGYWRDPALTAERFRTAPAGWMLDGPAYWTGDLVRAQASGALEFIGRRDHQVKIRGHRVELGEVEAALGALPAVSQAIVRALGDGTGGAVRLVAFVVLRQPASPEQLREHLRAKLPEPMVPSRFVLLESLPVLPNGKIDRSALDLQEEALIEATSTEATPSEAIPGPATGAAAILRRLWEEVLHRPDLPDDADFFALGGDSLSLMRMVAGATAAGLNLTPVDVFDYPTLRELISRTSATA